MQLVSITMVHIRTDITLIIVIMAKHILTHGKDISIGRQQSIASAATSLLDILLVSMYGVRDNLNSN